MMEKFNGNPKNAKNHPQIAFYIGSMQMGGSERNVIRLLEGLPNFGYRPALIVNSKAGPLLEKAIRLGNEVVEIPILPTLSGRLGFIFNTAKFLRNHHIDIVQGYNDISILYLSLAAKIARTPVLIFALRNTHLLEKPSIKMKIIAWVVRNLTNGVIVNSNQTAQQIRNKCRVPFERIKTAYNGVQIMGDRQADSAFQMRTKLGIRSSRKTIGLVARLDPVKKVETLIKTAVLLSDLPIQFLIVGDGSDRTNLEANMAAAGQADRFIFVGNQEDPFPWISALDIGVICSESEGFPQAILEYMAVGLPVVAPNVGGISELVVDGETGFLVSPSDPLAFAAALRRLLENLELNLKFGKAGQTKARDCFSLEKEILVHVSAYQSWFNQVV
jgi:glycosyltransferase involved in cell wall biosynthesis